MCWKKIKTATASSRIRSRRLHNKGRERERKKKERRHLQLPSHISFIVHIFRGHREEFVALEYTYIQCIYIHFRVSLGVLCPFQVPGIYLPRMWRGRTRSRGPRQPSRRSLPDLFLRRSPRTCEYGGRARHSETAAPAAPAAPPPRSNRISGGRSQGPYQKRVCTHI